MSGLHVQLPLAAKQQWIELIELAMEQKRAVLEQTAVHGTVADSLIVEKTKIMCGR